MAIYQSTDMVLITRDYCAVCEQVASIKFFTISKRPPLFQEPDILQVPFSTRE